MPISVKFLSILKVHAGTDSFIVPKTQASTLREVLLDIDKKFFAGSNLILDAQDAHINPALLIMVNGQDYHLLEGQLDCALDGTEEITLLSSLHGG